MRLRKCKIGSNENYSNLHPLWVLYCVKVSFLLLFMYSFKLGISVTFHSESQTFILNTTELQFWLYCGWAPHFQVFWLSIKMTRPWSWLMIFIHEFNYIDQFSVCQIPIKNWKLSFELRMTCWKSMVYNSVLIFLWWFFFLLLEPLLIKLESF